MNAYLHHRIIAGPREDLVPLVEWLADARAAGRELPVRAAFKIGRDVAEALVCLHLLGGSAGRIDPTSIHVDASASSAYLCPTEVPEDGVNGSHEHRVAHVADLAQLGQVLFELCCRRALRPGEDLKHLRAGFALVSLTNPKVPAAGDALIGALLAPTRGRGYERAKPVLDELRKIVDGMDRGPERAEPLRPQPAPDTRSMLGRKIDDLLAGWVPARIPAPDTPRAAHPATRRIAQGMLAALVMLKVFAPVPDAGATALVVPAASPRAAARPAANKAELTRRIIALQGELRRTR